MTSHYNQITSSLASIKIRENITSRVVKYFGSKDNNTTSVFLVSAANNMNIYLFLCQYNDKNELKSEEIFDYNKYAQEQSQINSNETSHILNDITNIILIPNKDNCFLIEAYNFTLEKYCFYYTSMTNNKITDFTVLAENDTQSSIVFHQEDSTRAYLSTIDGVYYIDIESFLNKENNKENTIRKIINFNELDSKGVIKVSSSLSSLDNKSLAIGIGSHLLVYDIITNQLIDENKNAHSNGILSLYFNPLKAFILISTGFDNLIKFWTIKELKLETFKISDSPHWVWQTSYHFTYSRLFLTCNSSSTVRLYVFNKDEDINDMKKANLNYDCIEYLEFDETVYSIDWSKINPWIFVGLSYNGMLHINKIPDDLKFKIMID